MKTISELILAAAAIALLAYLLLPIARKLGAWSLRAYSGLRYRGQKCLANVAEGTHDRGFMTKLGGATAITTRFTCVIYDGTNGTDYVVPSTSASDNIVGIAYDVVDASTDAIGDPINVAMIGGNGGTLKVVVSYAATAGDFIQSAGDGTAKLATTGGYVFGRVVKDTPSGDIAEFVPVPSFVAHS